MNEDRIAQAACARPLQLAHERRTKWLGVLGDLGVRGVALIALLLLSACSRVDKFGYINYWVDGDPEQGQVAIRAYGCDSCHIVPGIQTANATVGPPLDKWAARQYIAGAVPNTPSNLVRWIQDPQAVEPGTLMPDLNVTEADARHIAAYLYTLNEDNLLAALQSEDQAWRGQTGEQPVDFSHALHSGEMGLDCRYCHSSVEESEFAGMPSTHTCMTCHSQVWTASPMLAPVRESWETGKPIPWVRVYDLPDHTHFNHAAHVNNGVGCDTCHGRVDQMETVEKAVEPTMGWCLACHRAPEHYLRPREEVLNPAWQPPADQRARGRELMEQYDVPREVLTDCSLCHY